MAKWRFYTNLILRLNSKVKAIYFYCRKNVIPNNTKLGQCWLIVISCWPALKIVHLAVPFSKNRLSKIPNSGPTMSCSIALKIRKVSVRTISQPFLNRTIFHRFTHTTNFLPTICATWMEHNGTLLHCGPSSDLQWNASFHQKWNFSIWLKELLIRIN